MQKFDIHVCLISEQAAANLLPIFDKNIRPKKAIFLVTERMQKLADNLKRTFSQKGVAVNIIRLTDPYDFIELEKEITNAIDAYQYDDIALNLTGGTKPMAIVAQSIFAILDKPAFYVNSDNAQIILLPKVGEKALRFYSLQIQTELAPYLESYGYNIHQLGNTKINDEQSKLAYTLVKNYDQYKKFIPTLNWITNEKSSKEKYKYNLAENSTISDKFESFIYDLYKDYIINYDDSIIDFMNEENRFFLAGGWLEHYVYQEIKEIKKISDLALGVKVVNSHFKPQKNDFAKENQGNTNELDVAFMANNILHIIECKTKKMDDEKDILYKLETLKHYGGKMTKVCLVTYLPISQSLENRAKELNIDIIQTKDLQRIKTKIQEWIGKN